MKKGKKEEKAHKHPAAFRYIATRVIAFALALWLLCAGLLTWAVAEDLVQELQDVVHLTSAYLDSEIARIEVDPSSLPGTLEYQFPEHFAYLSTRKVDQLLPIVEPAECYNSGRWPKFLSDWAHNNEDWLRFVYEPAMVLFDKNGEILIKSGRVIQTFFYTTQENWDNGNTEPLGCAYIISDDERQYRRNSSYNNCTYYLFERSNIAAENFPESISSCRDLYGYFDGNQFIPADTAPSGKTCQHIYTWGDSYVTYDYQPLHVNRQQYDSLAEFLGYGFTDSMSAYGNLFETVIATGNKDYIWQDDDIIWCYEDMYGYAIAIRCWPLAYAALRLIPFYLISFAATAIFVWLFLKKVKFGFTAPIDNLIQEKSIRWIQGGIRKPWSEPLALEKAQNDLKQKLAEANTEIQRLNKALDYAKNAEENRRQLVSNLTHELKTPLAVIHSYAEGLQENIAEEKRGRYLSVITEESERMDAMVLEMLDLSRLEAGKVRLATEQFSLLAAAKAVTDKFTPMLEAKDLTLAYALEEDHMITADEGRISQAITNLVSNALKYAPKGSTIRVRVGLFSESNSFYVRTDGGSKNIRFSIENESEPLSDEKLKKVWDSFYRADPSRTEPGTGLGLAIVKSIVELHRGSCYAHNIQRKTADPAETGVEFGFCLPME